MPNYLVKLKDNCSQEILMALRSENINVIYTTEIIPNFIIIKTEKSLQQLQSHPLFRSIEKEPIGSVDV